MTLIYPSLISADLLNLGTVIKSIDPYCAGYHLDVMDFHFAPNLTWGPAFLEAIAGATAKKLWVHLMVENPDLWIEKLNLPPQTIVTFHIESTNSVAHIIKLIQNKSWLPSIAISPKTDVNECFPFLESAHQVLIMSVEPGHSGQQFMPAMIDKVEQLVEFRTFHKMNFRIGIDGGINKENINIVTKKGVDDIGVANAIFGQQDPVTALQELHVLLIK